MNGAMSQTCCAVDPVPARGWFRQFPTGRALRGLRTLTDGAGVLAGLVLLAFPWAAASAAPTADSPWSLTTHPARVQLTAERVKLPGDERMGLIGTSYLVEVAPGWSVGPAAYGAITGERGGLFTLGGELSHYRRLGGALGLEVGLYAGGGGGGSAPVGSGLMLRPHVDLLWDFAGQRAGLSLSRVRFSEGKIDSTQVGVVWSLLTDFPRFSPSMPSGARSGEQGSALARRAGAQRLGAGFDRMHAVLGFYSPRAGSLRVGGAPLDGRIGLAGARFEQALHDGLYWGVEAAGAASGGVAGYAEYLGTLGLETDWAADRLYLGGRVAVGMGGGGLVDVGGGLLIKAGGYGVVRLSSDVGLTFEAGMARSPQGSFRATYASTSVVWVLDGARGRLDPSRVARTEWVTGLERYPAARRDGSTRELRAVTLHVNRFVTESLYLTGQAHSALGGGAGGYTAGLLGAGFQQRWQGGWHAGVEALAGAAGGGGVDTAGGLIVQPMVYAGYSLAPDLALRVGAGRIDSLRGALGGKVVGLSLAYTFGVDRRGGR